MIKYSVGELTLIAIRIKCLEELQKLEDILLSLAGEYEKNELGAVFTVMSGKKSVL